MIKSINPATEEEIKSYDEMGLEEVSKIISSAENDFNEWRRSFFQHTMSNDEKCRCYFKETQREIFTVDDRGNGKAYRSVTL